MNHTTDATLLIIPAVAVCLLAIVATAAHRRLPPPLATRTTAVSMTIVSAAALPSLWIVSLGYLAHLPIIGPGLQWCSMALGVHQRPPAFVALPAVAISCLGFVRVLRLLRTHRSLRINQSGPVEVVESPEPFAVTIPGCGGRVVISRGLVRLLSAEELDAVVAHEMAHAVYRHDRYLLSARMTAAALPFITPVTKRLHFSLERWADEAAARRCGDRSVVAAALAKVALHGPTTTGALGFNSLGVSGRVEALLEPPSSAPTRRVILAIWGTVALSALVGLIQLHHLARLVASLCMM